MKTPDTLTFKQRLYNLNLPNTLTYCRISLIPVFIFIFYLPYQSTRLIAGIVFCIAGITDYLDGYMARYLEQVSKFGEFLDPVADKLLVATALVLLVSDPKLPYIALPAAVIIGREIAISALREWMAEIGRRSHLSVNYLGKVKTFFQIFAIILLIAFNPTTQWPLVLVGYFSLYVAAGLTLLSMLLYLRAALTARLTSLQ